MKISEINRNLFFNKTKLAWNPLTRLKQEETAWHFRLLHYLLD